jgi:hypothetical protein
VNLAGEKPCIIKKIFSGIRGSGAGVRMFLPASPASLSGSRLENSPSRHAYVTPSAYDIHSPVIRQESFKENKKMQTKLRKLINEITRFCRLPAFPEKQRGETAPNPTNILLQVNKDAVGATYCPPAHAEILSVCRQKLSQT